MESGEALQAPPVGSGASGWRRNEFESGGHRSGAKVGGTKVPEKNLSSLHFLLYKYS